MLTIKQHEDRIAHRHKVHFVQNHISKTARFMMLAEEAAEVSQAAAKIARILEGSNPTPKSMEEAWDDLVEEMNDVYLAYEVATGDEFEPIANFSKLDRCVERVCEANGISYPEHYGDVSRSAD